MKLEGKNSSRALNLEGITYLLGEGLDRLLFVAAVPALAGLR